MAHPVAGSPSVPASTDVPVYTVPEVTITPGPVDVPTHSVDAGPLGTTLSVTLLVLVVLSRTLRTLAPLWDMVPERLHWIATALAGSAALALATLPLVTDWYGYVNVMLGVVVATVLAHARGASERPAEPKAG